MCVSMKSFMFQIRYRASVGILAHKLRRVLEKRIFEVNLKQFYRHLSAWKAQYPNRQIIGKVARFSVELNVAMAAHYQESDSP